MFFPWIYFELGNMSVGADLKWVRLLEWAIYLKSFRLLTSASQKWLLWMTTFLRNILSVNLLVAYESSTLFFMCRRKKNYIGPFISIFRIHIKELFITTLIFTRDLYKNWKVVTFISFQYFHFNLQGKVPVYFCSLCDKQTSTDLQNYSFSCQYSFPSIGTK